MASAPEIWLTIRQIQRQRTTARANWIRCAVRPDGDRSMRVEVVAAPWSATRVSGVRRCAAGPRGETVTAIAREKYRADPVLSSQIKETGPNRGALRHRSTELRVARCPLRDRPRKHQQRQQGDQLRP